MIILILTATEIKRDILTFSKEWENIAEKPVSKEVQAFIDELQMNTDCCHSTTKTFTKDPLTGEDLRDSANTSSNDAQKAQEQNSSPITIFMSYSIPKSVWQGLWAESKALKYPIQFVIRGLPNNSFQELAKKIQEYGCPVNIDPTLFERYNITAVPAFVVRKKGLYKKHNHDQQDHDTVFLGNVSLSCVIDRSQKQGNTEKIKETRP